MRIISGKFRGKKLQSPVGLDTRPTSDRVRQAILNILEHRYEINYRDLYVLDAFAGTGALGIEALSRGATFATFVEQSLPALSVLKTNLESFVGHFEVLKGNFFHHSFHYKYGIIFLDPPYHQGLIELAIQKLKQSNALSEDALIVAEMAKDESVSVSLDVLSEHAYGGTKVLIGKII